MVRVRPRGQYDRARKSYARPFHYMQLAQKKLRIIPYNPNRTQKRHNPKIYFEKKKENNATKNILQFIYGNQTYKAGDSWSST